MGMEVDQSRQYQAAGGVDDYGVLHRAVHWRSHNAIVADINALHRIRTGRGIDHMAVLNDIIIFHFLFFLNHSECSVRSIMLFCISLDKVTK